MYTVDVDEHEPYINMPFLQKSEETFAKDIHIVTPNHLFVSWYAHKFSEKFVLVKCKKQLANRFCANILLCE